MKSTSKTRNCNRCAVTLDDRVVRLWDGNDYCEPCVSNLGHGMVQRLRHFPALKETLPHPLWRVVLRIFLFLSLGVGLFLAVPVVEVGWKQGDLAAAVRGFGLLLLLSLPVVLLFTGAAAYGFSMGRTSVFVKDGIVLVQSKGSDSITCRLAECEWFLGRTARTNCWATGRSVLLALPKDDGDRTGERLVSVGFTKSTREFWIAFLQFAGVRRRIPIKLKLRYALLINGIGAALLLAIPLFCYCAVAPLRAVLYSATRIEGLAYLSSFLAFLPGLIFAMLFVLGWPWSGRSLVPSQKSEKEIHVSTSRTAIVLTSVILANMAVPILFLRQFKLSTRLSYLAVIVVCTGVVSYVFGQHNARWQRKKYRRDSMETLNCRNQNES